MRLQCTIHLMEGSGDLSVVEEGNVRWCEYSGPLPLDLAQELVRRSGEKTAQENRQLLAEAIGVSDTSGQ